MIPGATVRLLGPDGVEKATITNYRGEYSFSGLRPGRYTLRASARDFAIYEKKALEVLPEVGTKHLIKLRLAFKASEIEVSGALPLETGSITVLRGEALNIVMTR